MQKTVPVIPEIDFNLIQFEQGNPNGLLNVAQQFILLNHLLCVEWRQS